MSAQLLRLPYTDQTFFYRIARITAEIVQGPIPKKVVDEERDEDVRSELGGLSGKRFQLSIEIDDCLPQEWFRESIDYVDLIRDDGQRIRCKTGLTYFHDEKYVIPLVAVEQGRQLIRIFAGAENLVPLYEVMFVTKEGNEGVFEVENSFRRARERNLGPHKLE
ncbi:MAG TPA: hypothetical protein VFQ60_00360 [Patescibacteria group bacterium]|nr:hypothetical protein [Patescibacteria group bacterium]